MTNDIDSYLRELQQALAGADRALVQDAVFDAEEYLRAEVAAGADFAQVVERYGTPQEVAAAYLGVPRPEAAPQATPTPPAAQTPPPYFGPMPVAPTAPGTPPANVGGPAAPGYAGPAAGAVKTAPSAWRQVFGVFTDARVYKALLYMLLSLITGVIYFTIVVTGLSTAASLLVLIIGIPLFLLVLGIVRGMALFEGRLVEVLLGTRMPRRPRAEPPNAGFLRRMAFWVKDGRTWASMAYMILMLPLGIIYFTIAVTGLAVSVGLITTPFWAWIAQWAELAYTYQGVTHTWELQIWAIPVAMILGALVLTGWLHLVRWIGRGHAAFAKAMLVRLAK